MGNLGILTFFAVSFIVDIVVDLRQGIALSHIWHECVLFVIALFALLRQLFLLTKKDHHIAKINTELLQAHATYQAWKTKTHASALEIRKLIDQQFGLWQLSQSEKDVAMMLIKGLSMKEIAEFRSTHEKTVRQQATTIYKKASLSGRQELAAFFLEDILSVPESTA